MPAPRHTLIASIDARIDAERAQAHALAVAAVVPLLPPREELHRELHRVADGEWREAREGLSRLLRDAYDAVHVARRALMNATLTPEAAPLAEEVERRYLAMGLDLEAQLRAPHLGLLPELPAPPPASSQCEVAQDVEPEHYRPPDTRARCAALTHAGRCAEPALDGGWCAAHLADSLGI